MDKKEFALKMHKQWAGKLNITANCPVKTAEDLAVAYTPGVAEPCLEIARDENLSYEYTWRHNTVAVISDGSAVLGLGDIGGVASMPVMEGKALLFKEFANINAIPLCVGTKDVDDIIKTVKLLEGSFGGVNLEDISAPRCFEIEQRLKKECSIPIFHDDQHGTAIVVLAALTNALKLVKKDIADVKIVVNGDGAAGTAITKLLIKAGADNIIVLNINGALTKDRTDLDYARKELAKITNIENISGDLSEVIEGADVFIGVSAPNVLTAEMVSKMNSKSIIFAMANPIPEIYPETAIKAGAFVVGTGRSDFANQINNVLAFPGVFRGTLDAKAFDINDDMNIAAAKAIASLVSENELKADYILPKAFDPRVCDAVALAVKDAAIKTKVCRK